MAALLLDKKMSPHVVQGQIVRTLFVISVCVIAKILAVSHNSEIGTTNVKDLLMRGAKPEQPEAYLCTSYQISEHLSYIYKFEALANVSTVHHILLYGCSGEPYSTNPVWQSSVLCSEGEQTILFAWAKNALPTVLPKGVGVRIGKASNVKSIVLQVHYARAFQKDEQPDYSGIRIYTTLEDQPFVAGIYLMIGSNFEIPPGNPSYPVDISCSFALEQSIFPFAFRPHSHRLGTVITGYLFNGTYYKIGKGNPMWPQTFYPAEAQIEIKPGDSVAARCTYNSSSMHHPVSDGSTGQDEMCNFYIMFFTKSSVVIPSGMCVGNNIPELTGTNFPPDVSVPLPPNPDLEEEAMGHHNHGSGTVVSKPESIHTSADTWTRDILMKGAKPSEPDAYLCAAYPVTEQEAYIYKFEALANASTAHHILVYGCNGEAFSDEPIWHCPGMCKGFQPSILFAWAKNAPPTVLPKDVGLRIGQRSTIKTIVLQVHYARAFNADEKPDNSGIKVYVTHEKQPFVAGIFLLASSLFSIPPGQPSYPVEVSCSFHMEKSIFPFAYRTHAHGLSTVITGYHYNNTYNQIGKGNPQWPQAFYPVKGKIEVKPGDHLAARCTYNSTSMTRKVSVGSTGNDEMCNFYIMFYTDNSVEDPSGQCNGDAVQSLTGNNFPKDVSEPLPPNPELEEEAKGHHHSSHGGSDSKAPVLAPADTKIQELLMKGARPDKHEAYFCSSYSLVDEESYIYKFEVVANMSTVHHLLVFGCDGEPFSSQSIWQCQQLQQCKTGKIVMYAWGRNAPPTVLPQGVGMRIGQKTNIKTIVLQVHYARQINANEPPDYSGVKIYTTQEKQPFVAGIYLMKPESFKIPPRTPSYPVDVSCKVSKEKSIFPFMYMAHSHSLGKVITGYHYNGSYHEFARGNPQWPQAFYPVTDMIEVKPGDYLAARCTYSSTFVDHPVEAGNFSSNEMCNLIIMFYTDNSERNPYDQCTKDSEPQITGIHFPHDVSVPLPPNPALEEEVNLHSHNGGLGNGEGGDINGIHFEHGLNFNSTWPSETVVLGQIGGVASDIDGNVYIFHRGSREWDSGSFSMDNNFMYQETPIPEDVIIVLNSEGKLVRKFGAGEYFMPHGIEVDLDGNIWITDVALHQVFKIPHGDTKPSLVLGQRFKHGSELSYFCKPTDVAVLSSGEFFVSDGYCNSRVLKFSKDGVLIKSWGERSLFSANPPPFNTFEIPHSITVSEENQLVCVADRENGRVQCFDLDGNFKHIIQHPEFGTRLFAIEQSPIYGGVLYAVNGPSFISSPDMSVQGFTVDIITGNLLEIWNVPQHLQNPHDVCVHSRSQSVYIGELNPRAVWKLYRSSSIINPKEPLPVQESKKPDGSFQTEMNKTDKTVVSTGTDDKISGGGIKTNMSLAGIKSTESNNGDVTPAILIGCLLVVPIIVLLIIILLVRAKQSGKLECCGQRKQAFSFRGMLGNSHKGFNPVSTEESDHESDHEEYRIPKQKNGLKIK